MVLPAGVNKASGLQAALDRLRLSVHNTVGVGDAENDHAFLDLCECSAATANGLESVKEQVDVVLSASDGAGVAALASSIRNDDLADVALPHRRIAFGKAADGSEIAFNPYVAGTVLFAGASGGGKSTAAMGLVERIVQQGYQTCVVDPEGDYEPFGGAIVLGDANAIPTLERSGAMPKG
jgi:hypothetical protein